MYSGLGNRVLSGLANKLLERITQLSAGKLNGEFWSSVVTSTVHSLSYSDAARCKFIFQQLVGGMIYADAHKTEMEGILVLAGSRECLDLFRGIVKLVVTGSSDTDCLQLQQGASWAKRVSPNFKETSFDVIGWMLFNRRLDKQALSFHYLMKFAYALAMVPLVSGENCATYVEEAVDHYVVARSLVRDGNLLSNMCTEYVALLLQLQRFSVSSPR